MPDNLRQCFNIDTEDDVFFHGKCLPFTRSDAICSMNETREQFNGISSYIDGSSIYGSDAITAEKLRSKKGGAMKTHALGPSLPTREKSQFDSEHGEHPEDLVVGDTRAIVQPGLASMHTVDQRT